MFVHVAARKRKAMRVSVNRTRYNRRDRSGTRKYQTAIYRRTPVTGRFVSLQASRPAKTMIRVHEIALDFAICVTNFRNEPLN